MELSQENKDRVVTIAKEISIDYLLGTNKLEESSEKQQLEKEIIMAISFDDNDQIEQLTANNFDAQIIYRSSVSLLNAMINILVTEISTNENITNLDSMLDAEIKKFLMMFISRDKFINNLSKALDADNENQNNQKDQ